MDTARQGCQKGRATQVTGRLSLHFSRLLEPEAVEPLAASRHHDTHTLTRLPPRLLHLLHHLCPSACVPCWWPCRISALAYACKRALARVRWKPSLARTLSAALMRRKPRRRCCVTDTVEGRTLACLHRFGRLLASRVPSSRGVSGTVPRRRCRCRPWRRDALLHGFPHTVRKRRVA